MTCSCNGRKDAHMQLCRKLQQNATAAVTEANRRFYAAFEHCNLQVCHTALQAHMKVSSSMC